MTTSTTTYYNASRGRVNGGLVTRVGMDPTETLDRFYWIATGGGKYTNGAIKGKKNNRKGWSRGR